MSVFRRGKIFWYEFNFGHRRIRESTKSKSKRLALEAERQRRRQIEESWNRVTRRALPPAFEKAADEWLKGREGRVAANTLSMARVALKHVLPAFGSKLLCDITAKHVEAYQQARLREGAQGRTVNIEVQTLRQVMKTNKCWQHLDGEIRLLKERKGIGKALTPEEEGRLLAECGKTDSACYAATVLALNTAMRKDEIRRLTWGQVDLFGGILTVGASKTQAGTGRAIPLNPAAVKALADWGNQLQDHRPEHYVFPRCENRQVDPLRPTQGWRTAWRNACKRAGVKMRFHDLRHTAITKLAESQASDQTIMAIAGHVSREMLERYSHIRMAAKRTAMNAIATPLPERSGAESDYPQKSPQSQVLENGSLRNLLN